MYAQWSELGKVAFKTSNNRFGELLETSHSGASSQGNLFRDSRIEQYQRRERISSLSPRAHMQTMITKEARRINRVEPLLYD